MPELPEVEVTRRRIKKLLVGRKIARVVTTKLSYFFLTSPRRLQQELSGCTVARLDRHGKYLLARLDSGSTLLLHLGMTGQLFGEGAKNKVGPVLNGLNGRKSGTVEGYSYSEANKNSGITWDEATFKDYIKDPKAKIPGTKMVFAGIKNEKESSDLWAFLAQYDKDGKTK